MKRPLLACVLLAAPMATAQAPAPAAPATGEGDADADGDAPEDAAATGEVTEAEAAPQPPPPPPKPKKPARPPATPMSDDTKLDRLQALEDLVEAYERESEAYRQEVRRVAERKYKERRRSIETNYKKQLAPVIKRERAYRLEAITAFERFIAKHPRDPTYTPDALFRLAELYFEKYDDEYQQNMERYRNDFETWNNAGAEGDPPEEPKPRFDRTIALYRQLINDFPNYRLLDGAYYLLGYTLRTQGDAEEGMQAWRTLVERYPNSRFYAEVWFRIGDYHFDEEEWPEAIQAFSKVTPIRDGAYYDKALYKLAWTYYLVNEFDKSVTLFFELLDFSWAKRLAGESEGGSVLEEEAVQYVAISFSDDNWERPNKYKTLIAGDSLDDEFAEFDVDYVAFANDYFDGAEKKAGEKKPYRRDIMAKLGDILFKQSKNRQAVMALEQAIALDELHRDAPKLQDMIIQAWEREREFEKASEARDVLVKKFGANSEWGKKHRNDSEARKQAEDLARVSLYKAAIYYHQQAQKYYEDQKQDLSIQFFKAAAASYGEYLQLYPHDKEAYELGYYLADTYYYSLDFRRAATQYAKVRDSTLGTKYRGDAAVNVVYSLERVIDAAVKNGELEDRNIFAPPTPSEDGTPPPQEEIPPLRMEYVGAVDKIVERSPEHEKAPAFSYAAAAIYYSYGHLDEGVKRFEKIIQAYPQHEAAKFAANFILDYWLGKKDWAQAAKYAAQFKSTLADDSGTFAKIEGGAKFQIAKKKLEDGEQALREDRISEGLALLEEGANQYLALLDEDPKREFADVMMYNAALSLEKARRPARAAGLYERLYKEYPDSEYAAEAMFRVGSKSEQAFDFNKAVDTYLALVDKYKESDRRADAQINAALALEGQQKYKQAAKEFENFAKLFPDNPEAPKVFFRAALVHKKRGNPAAEKSSLKRFIARYKSSSEQAPLVIEAYTRIGEIEKEKAKTAKKYKQRKAANKAAVKAWEQAVTQYNRAKGNPAAAYFAGKAAFLLAEEDFASYDDMSIKAKTGKKQAKELVSKSERLQKVEKTYKEIISDYKQAEWSLASLYRIGSLYDNLQKSIFDAPCPADIKRIDPIACDEYRTVLEDKAYAVEEKAVEAYRVAYEKSKELKISNEWTKRTLDALNLLRSSEFPIDKEPLVAPKRADIYRLGMVLPDGGAQELKATGVDTGASGAAEGEDGQSGGGQAAPTEEDDK